MCKTYIIIIKESIKHTYHKNILTPSFWRVKLAMKQHLDHQYTLTYYTYKLQKPFFFFMNYENIDKLLCSSGILSAGLGRIYFWPEASRSKVAKYKYVIGFHTICQIKEIGIYIRSLLFHIVAYACIWSWSYSLSFLLLSSVFF